MRFNKSEEEEANFYMNKDKASADIAKKVHDFLHSGGEIEEVGRGILASDRAPTKAEKEKNEARKRGNKKSAEARK